MLDARYTPETDAHNTIGNEAPEYVPAIPRQGPIIYCVRGTSPAHPATYGPSSTLVGPKIMIKRSSGDGRITGVLF